MRTRRFSLSIALTVRHPADGVCKNASAELMQESSHPGIERTYVALVEGLVNPPEMRSVIPA